MKKTMKCYIALAGLLTLLGITLTSADAFARINCQVKISQIWMAAPPNDTTTGVIIELVNTTGATIPGTNWPNNTWRRFYVGKALGDQGLNILLAAHATRRKVDVFIEGNAEPSSLVTRVGITQSPSL